MVRLRSPVSIGLFVLACAPETPPLPSVTAPPPAAPGAASPTLPAASGPTLATPAGPSDEAPHDGDAPEAPPLADASRPVPAAASPDSAFHLMAYRDGELSLHLLGDVPFVAGGGGLARFDAARDRLVHLEYGVSGQSDPGEAGRWDLRTFGGRWPGDAWLVT